MQEVYRSPWRKYMSKVSPEKDLSLLLQSRLIVRHQKTKTFTYEKGKYKS